MMSRHGHASASQAARLAMLALLFVAAGLAAGCGRTQLIAAPTRIAATATTISSNVPYTFPSRWQAAAGAPTQLSGFVFAPSAPQYGYACTIVYDAAHMLSAPGFFVTVDAGNTWAARTHIPFQSSPGCLVFVDQTDAQDVFVEQFLPISNQPTQSTPVLWRSRDGGTTWKQLSTNTPAGQVAWTNVVVVGSRLVASAGVPGAGESVAPLPNDLFSSDDGGATWTQMGQSIADRQLDLGPVTAAGATLFVESHGRCGGGCPTGAIGVPWMSAQGRGDFDAPLASLEPNAYWRSTDGGTSWTKSSLPVGAISGLRFTPSADGNRYFGVALIHGLDPNDLSVPAVLYSSDSGATWAPLPGMQGVEGGYPDPTTVGGPGGAELLAAPDGVVFAGTWHDGDLSPAGDAGVFQHRPSDTHPAWQPLAAGQQVQQWQAVAAYTGPVLWGLRPDIAAGFDLVWLSAP